MSIVRAGLDIHRAQITYDALELESGEVTTGRIAAMTETTQICAICDGRGGVRAVAVARSRRRRVALLRAINVGGRSTVRMAELRLTLLLPMPSTDCPHS